jgi:Carboxypeptidase regulatory-like domain
MKNTKALRQAPVFLLLAAVTAASLAAAEKHPAANAVLAGTVFDSNGHALPGCVVEIVSEAGPQQEQRGATDQRGEYAIRVLAGRFTVAVSRKGFQPQRKAVEVGEGEKSATTFLLSPM